MANVEFNYNGQIVTIQCKENDKLENIIQKFCSKVQKSKQQLHFLYSGQIISNYNLTFIELANLFDKSRKTLSIIAIDTYYNNDYSIIKEIKELKEKLNKANESKLKKNKEIQDFKDKLIFIESERINQIKDLKNTIENKDQQIKQLQKQIKNMLCSKCKEKMNKKEQIQVKENQGGKNKIKNEYNEYNNYEQNQFNEFMKKLMAVESQIEGAKISLAKNPDFNSEDAFKLFESNNKEYLDINDIKEGLNLIGLNLTEKQLNLLMKRFDLQKNGYISYADFFDMVIPFEKKQRQIVENRKPKFNYPSRSLSIFKEKTIYDLKNLFKIIIKSEEDINNEREILGTLRLKLKEIFILLDKKGKGYFEIDELYAYLENNGLLDKDKDADFLFIRFDKKRNGKIDYPEVEDELQTLY